jgi:precorrin-4 C11-methyltransferase
VDRHRHAKGGGVKALSPVLFVGAGPGDPELITVKGRAALAAADLVVYAGSLVPRELLQWARPEAKTVDSAPLDLEEIVAVMERACRAGRRVVRLHTGDPSLYGAIAEQMEALAARGIPCRVIPGVSAAFAAAAALGIEFTRPEIAQTLILTRAAGRTPVPESEALEKLAAHRTSMVVYLSVGQAREVAEALGRAYGPEAPLAVVYRASHPDEKIVRTTPAGLAESLRRAGIRRQAVIVAGRVLEAGGPGGFPRSRLYDRTFAHGFRPAAARPRGEPPARLPAAAGRTAPVAVWAVSAGGARLARRIAAGLPGGRVRLLERFARAGEAAFDRLEPAVAEAFPRCRGHVFVMAAGIVVRAIAARIRDKSVDPAVVVVDERGRHAVSLLSGHLGGANELAAAVAAITGGAPVITTATDVQGKPAIDLIAKALGLAIENPAAIAPVNAALLAGRAIGLHDPLELLAGRLPRARPVDLARPWRGRGPCVAVDDREIAAPPRALVLRPPSLAAGIGCNRGTPAGEIRDRLHACLAEAGLSPASLARLASIALKADEAGLLELARESGLPIEFFERRALRRVEGDVPNPSARVAAHVGVKSVCEAAAILAARGGPLIVPKRVSRNVTIAIARIAWRSSASGPEASPT